MKKKYVPKTLNEFLSETKTITLKRKYGERPTVTVGTNAPIRNQVLSYVAESGAVSKPDLKKYILGLREGGVSVAAANMFIKRNAKYFITENKDGITYYKLSNLGKRLVNRFVPAENADVSESVKTAREKLSMILESKKSINEQDELEDEEFELPDDEDLPAETIDDEGPAEEIDYEEEVPEEPEEVEVELEAEADQFEYEEDDEKITLTYYKEPRESEIEAEEEFEARKYDFKDKGRPGIYDEDVEDEEEDLDEEDLDEGMKAQFVSHKLTGKKASKLGGKLDPKLHNLLDDSQDKDEKELEGFEKEITESEGELSEEVKERMKALIENIIKESEEAQEEVNEEVQEEVNEEAQEEAQEELKAQTVSEAEEPSEEDELSDEDLDDIDLDDEAADDEEVDIEDEVKDEEGEDEVEKVEITEFIITVDDVDVAIEELADLGVEAEKVPIESEEVEVPVEIEDEEEVVEEPEESDEEAPEEPEEEMKESEVIEGDEKVEPISLGESEDVKKHKDLKESIQSFIEENYLNEEEDEELDVSDELNLGDQGEDAKELEDDEATNVEEPEYEEYKIKVKAEDWETLKGWLEEKGVDVGEMFGGEIETEEIVPAEDSVEAEAKGPAEEIDDEEIDFSGIGDDDDTKVDEEAMYSTTAFHRDDIDNDVEEEDEEVEECEK